MITAITLPQRPPFDAEQVIIDGLTDVCFFFGLNGSGMTTISQLVANEADVTNSSAIHWGNDTPAQTYVYNRDFIADNFANKASVPGVFTMSKGMVDAQKKIDELTEAIEKDSGKRGSAHDNLEQMSASVKL